MTDDAKVLTGTAAAIARWLGIEPLVVRLAFVVLVVAGGWGVVLYVAAWMWFRFVAEPSGEAAPRDPATEGERTFGFGLVVLGLLVQADLADVGFSAALVWPTAVIAVGIAVAARRVGSTEFRELLEGTGDVTGSAGSRRVVLRILVGTALLIVGLAALVGTDLSWSSFVRTVLAVGLVLVGVSVMFGPTLRSLAAALVDERNQRIRSDERARISAHLHDSVLQTLALVQKRSDDPAEVAALARRQERELRSWLFGAAEPEAGTLRGALAEVTAEVEDRYRVAVECVVVGDAALSPALSELVAATRESVVNSAKFSGESRVSVYVEARDGVAEVYVRDRGVGFDQADVPIDRRGLVDSVIGRMERAGGSASVRSAPGEGTEVHLSVAGIGAHR